MGCFFGSSLAGPLPCSLEGAHNLLLSWISGSFDPKSYHDHELSCFQSNPPSIQSAPHRSSTGPRSGPKNWKTSHKNIDSMELIHSKCLINVLVPLTMDRSKYRGGCEGPVIPSKARLEPPGRAWHARPSLINVHRNLRLSSDLLKAVRQQQGEEVLVLGRRTGDDQVSHRVLNPSA